MDYVRLGENIMKKDSICQVNIINQQNVTTAMNYLEKEKVQKSLRILTKFTDNKQINIIFYLLAVEELCVCDIACLLFLLLYYDYIYDLSMKFFDEIYSQEIPTRIMLILSISMCKRSNRVTEY